MTIKVKIKTSQEGMICLFAKGVVPSIYFFNKKKTTK